MLLLILASGTVAQANALQCDSAASLRTIKRMSLGVVDPRSVVRVENAHATGETSQGLECEAAVRVKPPAPGRPFTAYMRYETVIDGDHTGIRMVGRAH